MFNLHRLNMSATDRTELKIHLEAIRAILSRYLTPLTQDERREIFNIGPKMYAFVKESFSLAQQNPQLIPQFLKLSDFEIDFVEFENLMVLLTIIRQVERDMSDMQMLAGGEALQFAHIFYRYVKEQARLGIADAQVVYKALRALYPHKGGNRKPNGGGQEE